VPVAVYFWTFARSVETRFTPVNINKDRHCDVGLVRLFKAYLKTCLPLTCNTDRLRVNFRLSKFFLEKFYQADSLI